MSPRVALIALMILPLAACEGTGLPGFGAQQEPQAPTHSGPPTVSPLEQPIETGAAEGQPVSTAEAGTYNTAAFSARGNEPFWAVDVAGNTAIYKTPGNQRGQAVQVNRLAFAKGVEYIGVLNGRPFVVNIRSGACEDDMSGEDFPMTATLTVSGRTNRGCAGPATAEVAAKVAATKAPAPAAPKAKRTAAPKPAAAPRPAPVATTPPAETTAPAATTTTPAATGTPATTTPTTTAPATTAPAASTTTTPPTTTTDTPAATTAPVVPAPAMTLPTTPPVVPDAASGSAADEATQ